MRSIVGSWSSGSGDHAPKYDPAPHGIPKGRELTADEQAYAVNVICRWIEQDLVAAGRRAPR